MKKIFFIFFCFASIFLFTNCNSNSNKSKSAKSTKSDCISKTDARYAVNDYLNIQDVKATWESPTEWPCTERSNGWSVDVILYMRGGGPVNRTFFVDCSGNVQ